MFRPVLNSPIFNIDYTYYVRMFIRPCFEFAQCQLGKMGEIKTRVNKACYTVIQYVHTMNNIKDFK